MAKGGFSILIFAIFSAVSFENAWALEPFATDTTGFYLVKKSAGIDLYERWYAIKPDQPAREIRATFMIDTTPEAAIALMKDASKGKQWNKSTDTYNVVEAAEDSWICYIQYNLPWPVSNQDCVLHYNVHLKTDTVTISFNGIEHSLFPVYRRVQRIQEIRGKWIFIKTGNQFKVEYYITTTPSRTLPGWMTDPIIRNNLVDTMVSFRSLLEGKKD